MSTKITIGLRDADNKKLSINIAAPRADVTRDDCQSLADLIIDGEVFLTTAGTVPEEMYTAVKTVSEELE